MSRFLPFQKAKKVSRYGLLGYSNLVTFNKFGVVNK